MPTDTRQRQADILELKDRVSQEPGLSGRLLLSMSADLLLHSALEGARQEDYASAEGIKNYLSPKAIKAESYNDEVLALAQLWEGVFTEAISLLGTQWPNTLHDPSIFIGYLRRLDLVQAEAA